MRSSGHLRCDCVSFIFDLLITLKGRRTSAGDGSISYTAIFITFHWLRWLTSTESSFIDQVRKLLLHEIIDEFNGLLETILIRTSHVKE